MYTALFLASGTGLLAITNLLARGWPWPPSDIPATSSPQATRPSGTLVQQVAGRWADQHTATLNQLLAVSAIALGIMAAASVALGWLIAGRALGPLRRMTAATRAISEDSLHQRLAIPGPDDELKDLADTIDALLARLDDAFAAQRSFVASASHELRTPLTLARTLLQMALTQPHPTLAAYHATCQDLLDANDQQEQLIEALLTLARSQRGLDRREHLDLAGITTSALHARAADTTARKLAVNVSTGPAPVLGDARLLQRLAANLIDNAIRHNIPDGRVDIAVTAAAGHARLTIANTGLVIPPGQVDRLLQPFQRLPTTRPAGTDGLGLGLSIVAAIAKAHHAALTINPSPHGGLSVEISFALAAAPGTTRQAALAQH